MSLIPDGFSVLDKLEKHFDRVWVEVDVAFGRLDGMRGERGDEIRGKLHTLSVIFSHLGEKARSVFETNMKQEAQLVHFRDEVSELTSTNAALEKELEGRLIQLHAAQVHLQSYMRTDSSLEMDTLKAKLDAQIDSLKANVAREAKLAASVQQLERENAKLREWVKEAQDISAGSKLTARYLDKELSGRLQEIQLLISEIRYGKNMAVWSRLESEIALNHHRAVVHACRVRARCKGMPVPATRLAGNQRKALMSKPDATAGFISNEDRENGVRNILVVRANDEQLGLSIAGGREHGLPIIVSALEPGQAAARAHGLFIGDTILAVNGQDVRHATHSDAVAVLEKAVDEIQLDVVYLDLSDVEDEDEESIESSRHLHPGVSMMEVQPVAGNFPVSEASQAGFGGVESDTVDCQSYHLSQLTDSATVFNSDYTF